MRTKIAILLYLLGFKPLYSTDIAGNTTRGYGELDANGFWAYQLPYNWREEDETSSKL